MSDVIITVEGLGKKYSIRHQRDQRYVALRDVIARRATAPLRALKSKLESRREKTENGAESLTSDVGRLTSGRASTEEFWALRDINFEVKRGEVLGIIGRNGAGKTTLLKILSRITEPTEGRVRIRGRVASLLEVGTGFHPELTGRENIYLNGAVLGMTRAEIKKKFDEIVAFAETEKFLDTPVKRYSSGMYVRLAFAVAAHLEPEILVVDEVLAVGDAEFQKKCLGKMREVSTGGRTVLFVSHNLDAVAELCTRAVLLDQGTLLRDGNVLDCCAEYRGRHRGGTRTQPAEIDGILIEDLSFDPRSLVVTAPFRFTVRLKAVRKTLISDLSILFYSRSGVRAGIIDCRSEGWPLRLTSGSEVLVRGRVGSVPLVAGEYEIGLYLANERDHYDRFNIAELTVASRALGRAFLSYAPEHRGYVYFDHIAETLVRTDGTTNFHKI